VTVLFISYNGLTEPLGRRQVLPYVLGLGRKGWRFRVLSFEKAETGDPASRNAVVAALASVGAEWTPLVYHRRPPLISTAFDMLRGVWRAGSRPRLIHARSSVPGAMASLLRLRYRVPWIFDVRGFLAREYVDAGHWQASGLVYRGADAIERRLLYRADGLVFLTRRIEVELGRTGAVPPGRPREIVPCATDLEEFRPNPEARERVRSTLGLQGSRVLVYSGGVTGWYRIAEMAAFFRVARSEVDNLHFLVLSPQFEAARSAIANAGVSAHTTVLALRPEEVPDHLAAADAGICFVGDLPSKRASSPTKYGEYLACGLPVVTNPWTGDAAELRGQPSWILVESLNDGAYQDGARSLAAVLARPADAVRGARALAERELGLDAAIARYDRLYRNVLGVPA
jgi:glycosyltransferase involved in cell wall biosynthesis